MRQAFACGIVLLSFALGVSVAYLSYLPVSLSVKTITVTAQLSNGSPGNTSLRGTLVSVSTSSAVMSALDPYTGSSMDISFTPVDRSTMRDLSVGEQIYANIERSPGSRLLAYSVYPVAVP